MKFCSRFILAMLTASAACLPTIGHTKTLRWSTQGDILTLDPHAQSELLVLNAAAHVYEPLVAFDDDYQLVPVLATSWDMIAPTVWRFTLRQDVQFHDGAPFTADDAVFTIERALAPTSGVKIYAAGIVRARAVDAYTVDIETDGPNPVLARQLTNIFIMNRDWAQANQAVAPQDFTQRQETYSAHNTNGTGPYRLVSRTIDVRTVYAENPDWWGKANKKGNVNTIIYIPIAQHATRTAALLSGQIDLILDPPVQDIERLRRQAKVVEGAENRTIFLGMDQARTELKYSTLKGQNPFKDVRVREALYRAIDVDTIHKNVMRGLSIPTGALIAPQVQGWTPDMAERLPYDPARARALLKDAGYENRLNFTLDCPNNRYMNDEAICQALAAMWARVGVTVSVNALPRALFFPKVQSLDTSAYLFGASSQTLDAGIVLHAQIHSRNASGAGAFNLGQYHNAEVDRWIDQAQTELNPDARNAAMHQAFTLHAQDFGHIPLLHPMAPWAMSKNVHVQHRVDNLLIVDRIVID